MENEEDSILHLKDFFKGLYAVLKNYKIFECLQVQFLKFASHFCL